MTCFLVKLIISQTCCHNINISTSLQSEITVALYLFTQRILQDAALDFTEFLLLGCNFLWYPSALLTGGERQIEVSEQWDGKGSRNRAAYQTGRPQQVTGGIVARETQVSSLALALGKISLARSLGFFIFSTSLSQHIQSHAYTEYHKMKLQVLWLRNHINNFIYDPHIRNNLLVHQ